MYAVIKGDVAYVLRTDSLNKAIHWARSVLGDYDDIDYLMELGEKKKNNDRLDKLKIVKVSPREVNRRFLEGGVK